MKYLTLIFIFLFTLSAFSQESITLEECYQLVTKNYPLVKQAQLLDKQHKLDQDVISASKLPQLNLDAYASYQSEVLEFPSSMSGVDPINKDQYRATVSLNQLIYNGGAINASLNLKNAQLKTKQKQVEVSLYQIKQQVNQVYFSILLAQESQLLLKAKKEQLKAKIKEVESGIKYGTIIPSSEKVLKAELLKIHQQFQELENNKTALIETLERLTKQTFNTTTTFKKPEITIELTPDLNRPELELFELEKLEIENSENLLAKQKTPKIQGFATGAYGNPGLNTFDNSFHSFYTVGIKLNWNILDWNANKKQRESLAINKDILDNQTEVFKLNTSIELNQQQKEITKIENFIALDTDIIALRKEVLNAADSKLRNGVITSSAYITELTNLYEDKNTLVQHKIQLQLAKANYNVIKG
jgi:outer membrane protein TolC